MHATKYFNKVLFFFTNLSQGNFLYCPNIFILTKNLNLPVLVLNWNKTYYIEFFFVKFFFSFLKLLNTNLNAYSLFLSQLKSVFLWWQRVHRQGYACAFFQEDHNKLFRATANIQLCKFRLKELKLVQHQSQKLISFIYTEVATQRCS